MRLRRGWFGSPVVALALASCAAPTRPGDNGRPSISSVLPGEGSLLGGSTVTIRGSGFVQPVSVAIGGQPATGVTVQSSGVVTAETPGAANPGAVAVSVTTAAGTATLANAYVYLTPRPNEAPTIESLEIRSSRPGQPADMAEAGERLGVTAIVTDADTPASGLEFQWRPSAGTVVGSGATVEWHVPLTLATPAPVSLNLEVIDRGSHSHSVRARASTERVLRLHSSPEELAAMSRRFLQEFSRPQFNQDWRDVMTDFDLVGGVCPDPGLVMAEREDVIFHYTHFVMHDHSIGQASVSVSFGGLCSLPDRAGRPGDACIAVPVRWDSTDTRTGVRGVTTGVDYLSAAYSAGEHRWRLCSSDFPLQGTTERGHSFYTR